MTRRNTVVAGTLAVATLGMGAVYLGSQRSRATPQPAAIPTILTADSPAPPTSARQAREMHRPASRSQTLPADAPESVTFGVLQFAYRGAQFALESAPTRAEAKIRASSAAKVAQTDFEAARKLADPESSDDFGQMPRGVLEPAIERILFTMTPGSVHPEPVDTPRGFWVIRRNQ